MRKQIPFYDLTLSAATRRSVEKTLKSGWITTGPVVSEFESKIGRLLGVPNTVAVNSATAGMMLTLGALGAKPGSQVITSPFSFIAGVEVLLNAGLIPIFADIDPETLNLDPVDVERKITKKTSIIMTVDIAGYPCDYRALSKLSRAHRIPILSDSAHALGSTLDGKSVAQWADVSVYSFHATKNLTCGEGGMVVSRNKATVERVRSWSKHAMTANAFERKRKGNWSYDVTDVGFKANMSDILAAVGLGELESFDKRQQKRERLALRYISNLSIAEEYLAVPRLDAGFHHAWHLFIVRLNLKQLRIDRNDVIAKMKAAGIGCSVHYRPINTLSFALRKGKPALRFPYAEQAGQSVMSLPLYPDLTPGDVDRVSDTLISILRRRAR